MKTIIIEDVDLMTDQEELDLKAYLISSNIEFKIEVN